MDTLLRSLPDRVANATHGRSPHALLPGAFADRLAAAALQAQVSDRLPSLLLAGLIRHGHERAVMRVLQQRHSLATVRTLVGDDAKLPFSERRRLLEAFVCSDELPDSAVHELLPLSASAMHCIGALLLRHDHERVRVQWRVQLVRSAPAHYFEAASAAWHAGGVRSEEDERAVCETLLIALTADNLPAEVVQQCETALVQAVHDRLSSSVPSVRRAAMAVAEQLAARRAAPSEPLDFGVDLSECYRWRDEQKRRPPSPPPPASAAPHARSARRRREWSDAEIADAPAFCDTDDDDVAEASDDVAESEDEEASSDSELDGLPNLLTPQAQQNPLVTGSTKAAARLHVPLFLSDCVKVLRDRECGAEKFLQALQRIAAIADARPDDRDLGDTCRTCAVLLLHLINEYGLDEFWELRQRAMTALVCAAPQAVALYIGEQFYGVNFDMQQRILMIDAMQAAIERLTAEPAASDEGQVTEAQTESTATRRWGYATTTGKQALERRRRLAESTPTAAPLDNSVAGLFFWPFLSRFDVPATATGALQLLVESSDGIQGGLLARLAAYLARVVECLGESVGDDSARMQWALLDFALRVRTHADAFVRRAAAYAMMACLPALVRKRPSDRRLNAAIDYLQTSAAADDDADVRAMCAGALHAAVEATR